MEKYIVYFTKMREQREITRVQVTGDCACGLHLMDNSLDWSWFTYVLIVVFFIFPYIFAKRTTTYDMVYWLGRWKIGSSYCFSALGCFPDMFLSGKA